jgi:hypothetical protein
MAQPVEVSMKTKIIIFNRSLLYYFVIKDLCPYIPTAALNSTYISGVSAVLNDTGSSEK